MQSKVDFIQTAKQNFNDAVRDLLYPKNEKEEQVYKSLVAYIYRLRKQRKVTTLQVEEIFHVSYIRALEYINKNEIEIDKPVAFLKKTALNVIRETVRQEMKYSFYEPADIDKFSDDTQNKVSNASFKFAEELNGPEIKQLNLALNKLSPTEYEILYLWKVKQMRWKDIVEKVKNEEELSVNTAKKRGQRIMEKLRKEIKLLPFLYLLGL